MDKKRYVWVLLTMRSSSSLVAPDAVCIRSLLLIGAVSPWIRRSPLQASGERSPKKQSGMKGFDRLNQLDKLAGQNEDSDVSRINAAAGKAYVQVDPAIYEMIEYAKEYSAKSQGEWDITVGVMTNLWRIGNDDQHVPSADEISQALMKVNYKDILLRPEDHSVMLAKPGMTIDLGGVAKGYACR